MIAPGTISSGNQRVTRIASDGIGGQAYVDATRQWMSRTGNSKHWVFPAFAQIGGHRATVESPAMIFNRARIEGVEVDFHVFCRFISQLEDIEINHVPYRGSPPLVADLLGGHIEFALARFARREAGAEYARGDARGGGGRDRIDPAAGRSRARSAHLTPF